jgi:DNA-directed RNA polymerase specialized sigma24 family protein
MCGYWANVKKLSQARVMAARFSSTQIGELTTPSPQVDLNRYRPLLRLQIRQMELDPPLQRRFDSSDIIQETMLRAHADLARFRGQTEAELVSSLQEILRRSGQAAAF